MAMTLTPGYDFTPTEVPTQAKLKTMLDSAVLTGIDISQIDTTLVGIKQGNTDVSLPGEGWMWRDAINSLWIKNANGVVKLFRANWGGWETNRFIINQTQMANGLPGKIQDTIVALVSPTGDSGATPIFKRIDKVSPNNRYPFKALDTAVSGSYLRCLGRGGHAIQSYGITPSDRPTYVAYNNLGYQYFIQEPFPNNTVVYGPIGLNLDKLESTTSHLNIYWHFGVRMHQD